jgi:hypothetical protein
VAGDEDDRDAFHRLRAPPQEALGIAGFHPSDVHAVDPNTGGNPLWRARENQAEHGACDRQKKKRKRTALDAHARRGLSPAPRARRNSP